MKSSSTVLFKNAYLYDDTAVCHLHKYILIRDGKFAYIGSQKPDITDETCIIEGGYISKPFCDYHFHLPGSLLFDTFGINLCNCRTVEEYADYLKNETEGLDVVRGFGWEVEPLRRFFSRPGFESPLKYLDEIFPDKPAFIFSLDFHSCWCNTIALNDLKSSGIKSDFRDKEIPGGADCILHEQIADRIFQSEKFSFTEAQLRTAILLQQDQFLNLGITEVFSLMFIGVSYYKMLSVLHDLDVEGKLKVKIYFSYTAYPHERMEDIAFAIKKSMSFQSQHLILASVKVYADGVIDNHSAFLMEPYEDNGENGSRIWGEEEFASIINLSASFGLPIHVHAIGDAAVEFAAKSLAKTSPPDFGRHIITHLQLCRYDTMKVMADKNIVACMQPFWFYRGQYACAVDLMRLGIRAYSEYPVKSLFAAGVKVLFSSDCPATETFNPIIGINTAAHNDGSSEIISRWEALRAYYAGAYFEEPYGIKIGDDANFIVLNADVALSSNAKVLSTWLKGKKVSYSAQMD